VPFAPFVLGLQCAPRSADLQRVVVAFQLHQRLGQRIVHLGQTIDRARPGLEGKNRAEAGDRGVELAPLRQSEPQIVVRRRMIGAQHQGVAEAGLCFFVAALGAQCRAEVVAGVNQPRVQRQRPAEPSLGLGMAPLGRQCVADVILQARDVRDLLLRLAQPLERCRGLAAVGADHAQQVQCLGVARFLRQHLPRAMLSRLGPAGAVLGSGPGHRGGGGQERPAGGIDAEPMAQRVQHTAGLGVSGVSHGCRSSDAWGPPCVSAWPASRRCRRAGRRSSPGW